MATVGEDKQLLSAIETLEALEAKGDIRPTEAAALERLRARRDGAQENVQDFNSRMMGVAHDLTFGFPEVVSGVASAVKGEGYTAGRDASRENHREAFRADPDAYRSGQMAGAGMSMVMPGIGLARAVKGANPIVKALAFGTAGAVDGANQGIQDAQIDGRPLDTAGDYWRAARVPMAVGGVAGAAVPTVAWGAGAAARGIGEARLPNLGDASGMTSRVLSREFGNVMDGGRDIARYLDTLPPEKMLVDLPEGRAVGRAVADAGGPGATELRRAIEARQQGAGSRINADIDQRLGAPTAAFDETRRLAAERSGKLGPEYDAALAYQGPFDVQDLGNNLDQMIARAGPDSGATLSRFRNALNERTTAEQLHWLRSDLSDQISDAPTKSNVLLKQALQEIDAKLDTIPGYAEARTGYANNRAMDRAIDEGREWAKGGRYSAMDATEFRAEWDRMSDAQKDAFRAGVRRDLSGLMGTARNDAAAAWGELNKGMNQDKLRIILGDAETDALLKRVFGEQEFARTSNDIVNQSITSRAQETRKRMGPVVNPETGRREGVIGRVKGNTLDAAGNAVLDAMFYGPRSQRFTEEAGRVLSAQGADLDAIVQALLRNNAQVQATDKTSGAVANIVRRLGMAGVGALSSATK